MELFSTFFLPGLWNACTHTIPFISTFVAFKIKTRRYSSEENKKIKAGAEKGEGERRILLQSCDTEAGPTVKKPVLLPPSPYFSLRNPFLSALRGDTWLQFANSSPQINELPCPRIPWNNFWLLKLPLLFFKHLGCNCLALKIHLQKTPSKAKCKGRLNCVA